jgi:hypothetical protein
VKFWELGSVCRAEPQLMERLADNPAWATYLEWLRDFARIVNEQDRGKLDSPVPLAACKHVLAGSRIRYFMSGGYLRMVRAGPSDRVLSAVEVLELYGGSLLEDVREYGLARVPPSLLE